LLRVSAFGGIQSHIHSTFIFSELVTVVKGLWIQKLLLLLLYLSQGKPPSTPEPESTSATFHWAERFLALFSGQAEEPFQALTLLHCSFVSLPPLTLLFFVISTSNSLPNHSQGFPLQSEIKQPNAEEFPQNSQSCFRKKSSLSIL